MTHATEFCYLIGLHEFAITISMWMCRNHNRACQEIWVRLDWMYILAQISFRSDLQASNFTAFIPKVYKFSFWIIDYPCMPDKSGDKIFPTLTEIMHPCSLFPTSYFFLQLCTTQSAKIHISSTSIYWLLSTTLIPCLACSLSPWYNAYSKVTTKFKVW